MMMLPFFGTFLAKPNAIHKWLSLCLASVFACWQYAFHDWASTKSTLRCLSLSYKLAHIVYFFCTRNSFHKHLQFSSLLCFRLNWGAVKSSHAAVLRLLVDSVFIQTQVSIQEGALFPDQLGMGAPLLSSQRERLRLVSKLLVILDVAGWLNDPSLSLQAAIMCYTLLVPLIQLGITAKPVLKVRGISYKSLCSSSMTQSSYPLFIRISYCMPFPLQTHGGFNFIEFWAVGKLDFTSLILGLFGAS